MRHSCHALTTSSTAERDFQLQSSIQELTQEGVSEEKVDRCLADLLEVRNAQLRFQILSDLLTNQKSEEEGLQKLVKQIMDTFDNSDKNGDKNSDKNISIENRIWRSKVMKIDKTLALFRELFKNKMPQEVIEGLGSLQETLCLEMMTDIEDVEELLQIVKITEESGARDDDDGDLIVSFSEFLTCFEIDGDISQERGASLRPGGTFCI